MITGSFKPASVEEAVKLKKELGKSAGFLAGGTVVNAAFSHHKVDQAIHLEQLGLNTISKKGEEIIIDSGVTLQALLDNSAVPVVLKKAASHFVNRNIRNIATIGGNIGGKKSSADLLPALIVLDAQLTVANAKGEQTISVQDYVSGDSQDLILNIKIKNDSQRKYAITQWARTAVDISILTAGVSYQLDNNKIINPIVVVGGVGKSVIRLAEVEAKLNG
ncbi:MAG: FAD binding domain-containing protein, partial [Spirochaetes bacterium]|nr:FAD binding domain-containing protein [Spirochaetota bacterium]